MTALKNRMDSANFSLTILSKIASADKLAAKECVDIYGGMIWSLAKKFTVSEIDAEKAVQEIFIDIWQNAEYCDLTLSDEKVWIALIARRRLSKYALVNKHQKQTNTAKNIAQINSIEAESYQLPIN